MSFSRFKGPQFKPQPGAKIDFSHSTGKDLVACFLLNERFGTTTWDIKKGYLGTFNNMTVANWVGDPWGGGVNFTGNAANTFINIPDNSEFSPITTTQLSVGCRFFQRTSTGGGIRDWLVSKGAASNYEWGLAINSGNLYGEMWDSAGNSIAQVIAGAVSLNAWHSAFMTLDEGGLSLYLDGFLTGFAPGSTLATSNTTSALQIANRADGGDSNLDGIIDYVMIWKQSLSAGQAKQMHQDPFQNILGTRRYFISASVSILPTRTLLGVGI